MCGHLTLGDLRTLLQWNRLLKHDVQNNLSITVEQCTGCTAGAPPALKRYVYIASIGRQFNEIVCVDHYWLDEVCPFHEMHHFFRYSAVQPVVTTSLVEAVVPFANFWLPQFWQPHTVRGDLAFRFDKSKLLLTQYNIHFSGTSSSTIQKTA